MNARGVKGPLLTLILLVATVAVRADDADSARLSEIRARIEALSRQLTQSRHELDAHRAALREVERQTGTLVAAMRANTESRARQERALATLKREQTRERAALANEQHRLARDLRAAYMLGPEDYWKLLLNQDDPARGARMLGYYRYLSAARNAELVAVRARLARLAATQRDIDVRLARLAQLRTEQARKKAELAVAYQRRAALLAQARARVQNQSEEIDRLRADARRLARLVQGLHRALPPLPAPARDFRAAKGRLPLPVRGRIAARFGAPQAGGLRWRGIFIATAPGQDVRAVYPGRVLYADWLRGFGLLLIVDHGNGYMTLYAHNESLFKRAGDEVSAGETIAVTGDTGGASEPGLYFEVRHNGEPRDPLHWCRR